MEEEPLKIIEDKAYAQAEAYFFKSLPQQSNDNPHLYFVFSSPGAGKSTNIKPLLKEQLGANKPVIMEIDELKSFIPENFDIAKITNKWFLRLVDKAISEKRNLIIMRLRNMLMPQQTLRIYKKAKSEGYITHANIVALDKVRSRLGMIHRYEFALDSKNIEDQQIRENYPRKPDFLKHKIFYRVLPFITAVCCCSKYVDVIEVFDRERNRLAWLNKNTGDKSEKSPLGALLKERKRSWERWEKEKFNTRKHQAEEKIKEHKGSVLDMMKFKWFTKTRKNK